MKTDRQGNFASIRAAAVWEDRWVRFRLALKQHGVERGFHEFYRGWVLAWVKFIKPRKFEEGNLEDVRMLLEGMEGTGRLMAELLYGRDCVSWNALVCG